jgi:hypothetical protein
MQEESNITLCSKSMRKLLFLSNCNISAWKIKHIKNYMSEQYLGNWIKQTYPQLPKHDNHTTYLR